MDNHRCKDEKLSNKTVRGVQISNSKFSFFSVAWVGSIAMVGNGLYAPVIGKLYNRFGARTVAFAGSVICVVSLIATAKVSNLYIMFITYGALFGFGSCGVFIITYIAVPRYFKKWRSLSLGLIAMGPGGGVFIMSPLVQELFETFGWRGTFLCMAGIISVTCFMAFVYQPIVLESEKLELKDDKKFWDISLLRHKRFLICVTATTIIYFGHYVAPVHMVRLFTIESCRLASAKSFFAFHPFLFSPEMCAGHKGTSQNK